MKKPIVRNWMRYWAGTLAVSGMLVVGACSSDSERTAEDRTTTETETSIPARENVSNQDITETDVEADATVDAQQQPATSGTTDQSTQTSDQSTQTTTNNNTASKNWSSSRWSGSSVSNIDKHIEKFSEVNEAIEQSLAEIAGEGDATNMAQQDPNSTQNNQNMANTAEGTEQSGVTYDNMSNQNASDAEQSTEQEMTQAEGTEGVEMETTATEETDQNRTNMVNTDQQSTTYQNLNNTEEVDAEADADANADVDANAETDPDVAVDVDEDPNTDAAIDADADVDADIDTETTGNGVDVDAAIDADADVDTSTDEDTEADVDANADVDTDANVDADVNAETDTQMQTDNMNNTTETMPATDNMSAEAEEVDYSAMFEDVEDTEQYSALELARMNPNLSTFVSMVEQAGLAASFEGEGPVTIFAPTNQAFEQLSKERYDELQDPAKLAEVLNLHILANEEVSTALMNSRSYIDREEGEDVEIATEMDGTVYYVGGARIVKSDIETSNGVLHVVDGIIETSPDAGPGPGLD